MYCVEFDISTWFTHNSLHSKKAQLATGLSCQLANIRMLLPELWQVDSQNLLSTGLLQVVSTSCNKSANDKLQGCFVATGY